MEFTLRTVIIFILLLIAALLIIALMQVWTGQSNNIVQGIFDFFNKLWTSPQPQTSPSPTTGDGSAPRSEPETGEIRIDIGKR